ncbi:MAG: BCD family MFS transporter [Anaerolineae bacterium]
MSEKQDGLSVARNIKIAFFHLGSGMSDVLTTGVWNRIMISDLGVSATPVSLLVSLRYFLAPLGLWAGRMSDDHRVLGFRRLAWVWFGRLLMVLSTFGLGFGTVELMQGSAGVALNPWLIIVLSLVLFSLGNALSGSTFLALIYDRSTEVQRGRAVGIVWTFLLLGFTVGGIVFSILLPRDETLAGFSFAPADLLRMFVIAGSLFFSFWFFSLLGEERRNASATITPVPDAPQHTIKSDVKLVWRTPAMRYFLFYLTLSMFFAFSQDPILEPFAGDVFDMDASTTNRFAAYWGGASILASLGSLWLLRQRNTWTHTRLSQMGVAILLVTFALFTLVAFVQLEALIMPGLITLGVGLGFWNIGTLGLMMDMSPIGRAGTFLGFWSMSVTFARGGGIASGGIVRDVALFFSGDLAVAYGVVFGGAFLGLLVAQWFLQRIAVDEYKVTQQLTESEDMATVLANAMD